MELDCLPERGEERRGDEEGSNVSSGHDLHVSWNCVCFIRR